MTIFRDRTFPRVFSAWQKKTIRRVDDLGVAVKLSQPSPMTY